MTDGEPFVFFTERRLVALTGLKAKSLSELVNYLGEVPGSSIFYHTHHQYLSHHFERPVFHNDFSLWVSRALQDEELAEKLAAIDLLSFTTIHQLREAIIQTMKSHSAQSDRASRECPPGDEFHFCKSKSFIMPIGLVAEDVPDFFEKLSRVSNVSLYFHFFEARLRLERPTNDFSRWLSAREEKQLASAINSIDPYRMTLDELRNEIIKLGKRSRSKRQRG